jgi:hypothetical protein
MNHLLGGNRLAAVLAGGVCLILAAALMRQVPAEEPSVVLKPAVVPA